MELRKTTTLIILLLSYSYISAQYSGKYIIQKTKENIKKYTNYKIEFTAKYINLKAQDTFKNEITQRTLAENNLPYYGYSLGVIKPTTNVITVYNSEDLCQWYGKGYSYTNFNKNFRQTN